MASTVISISLSEAQAWKLEQLEKKTGISKSGLMQRALMLLLSEYSSVPFHGGSFPGNVTPETIEAEYKERS